MKTLSFADSSIFGRSVVVSASAGSGKTFTLTVFVLLALGRIEARPFEIIATTFSEAAAADLRERLLRPLDLLASLSLGAWQKILPLDSSFRADPDSLGISDRLKKSIEELKETVPYFGRQPWMDSASSAQAFWKRTRREAELMQVATIHSLANGLLRKGNDTIERIFEADHPALLRVLRQAMRDVADVPEDHPNFEASNALLNWADRQWQTLSESHDGHLDALGHFGGKSAEAARLYLQRALDEAQTAIRPFVNDPLLAKNIGGKTSRFFDADKLLPLPPHGSPFSGQIHWAERQSNAIDRPSHNLQDYYSDGFKQAFQTLSAAASAWEAWISAILAAALERFEEFKSERGIATFGDMVRSALVGLKNGSIEPPRPKLLLVDEYQDTSQAQDALLSALGAEKIVRVGDAKQAIYGFRGGNSDLLLGHIESGGESAFRLASNFRSAPPIVEIANTFVKKIWPAKDAAFKGMEADQVPLAKGDCRVGAVFVASKSKGTDLPSLSSWIAALSSESGWEEAFDNNSGDASASTRALLLRQRTKLPDLLLRLKKEGIQPYVLAKEGFWDSPGIRLVMAGLEAAAHPSRPLPCAILLRHLIGLSDSELHRLMPIRGIDNLDSEKIPIEKRPAIAWLQSIRTSSSQEFAASLLAQGNLLAAMASLDAHGAMEPARARRNLAGFLAMLQDCPANPGTAFAILDEWRNGKEQGDLPSSGYDADLIIQTVHGSKGLEYDNVVLPLLNNRIGGAKKGHIATSPDDGSLLFAWKLGNEPGEAYQKIVEMVEARQRRDDLNLFYVAITRAKKRLCLLIQAPEKENSEKEMSEAQKKRAKTRVEAETKEQKPHFSWAQMGKELTASHQDLAELEAPPPAAKPRQLCQPVLNRPKHEMQLFESTSALDASDLSSPEYNAENLRARHEGEAMHAYIQNLLVRWEDAEAFDQLLNTPPDLPNAKENALRFLDSFESRGWRSLRRRTELNLEGAAAGGGKGRADLVVWDSGCIHIIDFKNIHKLTAENLETFSRQLNRYASAMGNEGNPIRCWLALLKSGDWREVAVNP
jgi:ATP-dependent exoDNAse (exonuclease V) beta subunit